MEIHFLHTYFFIWCFIVIKIFSHHMNIYLPLLQAATCFIVLVFEPQSKKFDAKITLKESESTGGCKYSKRKEKEWKK